MSAIGRNTQHPLLMRLEVASITPAKGGDYWSLQRRHGASEERWLDLAHHATRADAAAALERVVDNAHADRHVFRIEHVPQEQHA